MFRMRPAILSLTSLIVILAAGQSAVAEKTKAELRAEVTRKIDTLERAAALLQQTHEGLQYEKDRMEYLRHKATINFQDNAYKVYLKGVLDVYDKVSMPGKMAVKEVLAMSIKAFAKTTFKEGLSMSIEIFKNIVWEPQVWTERTVILRYDEMYDKAVKRYGKIRRLYGDLSGIMKAPLDRFDDDQNPLPSAKAWWRDGDGQKDDGAELTTRKTVVIKNLSEKIARQLEWEMQQIRDDRKVIMKDIYALKKRLVELQSSDPFVDVPQEKDSDEPELKEKKYYNGETLYSIYTYYVDPKTEREVMHGSVQIFRPDGTVQTRGQHKHGKKHGTWESYHPDGRLQNRVTYDQDKKVGTAEWFHANGQKALVETYNERGQPYGVHRGWWPNGVLREEIHFEAGQQVKKSRWNIDGRPW